MATHPAAGSDGDPRPHIGRADPAILLASLVGITGDTHRIDEFTPHFTYDYNGGIAAVLPDDIRARLDTWALEVLTDTDSRGARGPLELEDAVFLSLAQALTGMPQEARSLPFLREQGGFVSFVPTVPRTQVPPPGFRLAIVGAGMAGVALAVAARATGVDFAVLEKQDGLGGVWRQNRYPGVGVDTPSKYYSFSFAVNAEWTHAFPEGEEFLDYLHQVALRHDVLDRFVFGAEVTGATWDEEGRVWHVDYLTADGPAQLTADAVVTAAGFLTNPKLPEVEGIDTFRGEWFHSADWNHACDLRGKRVGVVGTGCTSVQVVDALADDIGSLTLFQRQPHWVFPPAASNRLPDAERWLLRHVPGYANWARLHTFLVIGDANYPAVRHDPEWAATHDRSISAANDVMLKVAQQYLDTAFADRPDLKEKVTPDFAVMGKRPVRDPGGYYTALKKPTTTVVTAGLARVVPEGIVDEDGVLHELDVIVYATGFTLEYLSSWSIVGRDGVKLADLWGESPLAYNGCMVPGFPNLFVTSGPHSSASHGGGHNFTVEAVTHYVTECLQTLFETGSASIEVRPEAYERWGREIREAMADSVWAREQRANTYFRNGRGEVILASPFLMEDFWNRLREPDPDDVELR
ncbi:flavin-containing monooxygenase [Streptomyces viridiviolaceus]